MTIELAAAPGRAARRAVIALRLASVETARPVSRRSHAGLNALPPLVMLNLAEALEAGPPNGAPSAHWRLLTSHKVADVADARRIVSCLTRALDH